MNFDNVYESVNEVIETVGDLANDAQEHFDATGLEGLYEGDLVKAIEGSDFDNKEQIKEVMESFDLDGNKLFKASAKFVGSSLGVIATLISPDPVSYAYTFGLGTSAILAGKEIADILGENKKSENLKMLDQQVSLGKSI